MVCLHCLTLIPIPIQTDLGLMIMLRSVYTGPTPSPISIPILVPMAPVPNLALISVPIRCNLTSFHYDFTLESSSELVPV